MQSPVGFARLQRGWLRRITGNPYRARVIHSNPIGGRLRLEVGNPDLHAINLEAALAYVLKGASPEAATQFGLERLAAIWGCPVADVLASLPDGALAD